MVLGTRGKITSLPELGRVAYLRKASYGMTALRLRPRRYTTVSPLPRPAMETLGPVLAEKEQAENHLTASGLIYTIIRPGGLKSDLPQGKGVLTENPLIAGSVYRADVAAMVCRCLTSERAQNKILSAVDRTMLYGNPVFEEFSL